MRKTGFILLILAVIIGLGGYLVLSSQPGDDEPETDRGMTNSSDIRSETTNSPSENQNNPDDDDSSAAQQIEIVNTAYQPANISVKKGTTVIWTNRDSVRHDVMPDEEREGFTGSKLLAKDESYSFTFTTPGTYSYHCSPHPSMTGTITVTE